MASSFDLRPYPDADGKGTSTTRGSQVKPDKGLGTGDTFATRGLKVKPDKALATGDTYQLLYDEWKALPSDISVKDDWESHVMQIVPDESAFDFAVWMQRKSDSELIQYLEKADWKHSNEALHEATSRMGSIYDRNYIFWKASLFRPSNKTWLASNSRLWLSPNSRALHPEVADMAICEFHQITTVLPQNFLLGLRYKPINSPEERKGFLFATIGNGHDFLPKSFGMLTAFLENRETQKKSA